MSDKYLNPTGLGTVKTWVDNKLIGKVNTSDVATDSNYGIELGQVCVLRRKRQARGWWTHGTVSNNHRIICSEQQRAESSG